MSKDFDIEKLSYNDFSDAEVKSYEELGEKLNINFENKKVEGKKNLKLENLREIEREFYEELEIGEVLKYKFSGVMGGMQYLSSTIFSADYFMTPFAFMDVGTKMKFYVTDRKVIIFEVGSYLKIMRKYIMNFKDIKRFKCNKKKSKVTFFCNKDKYKKIRMCDSPWFYYIFQGRFEFSITNDNKEEIINYFYKKINSLS
ncbi:MAG: hypothetical protein RSC24_14470 [Clostridium sp.]